MNQLGSRHDTNLKKSEERHQQVCRISVLVAYITTLNEIDKSALRLKDIYCGVNFSIGMDIAKLYSLAYWCSNMQISAQSFFDLCTSGVLKV